MMRATSALIAVLSCAVAPTTLACFPAADAKPTTELTELRLPERSPDPVVVYAAGNYEIRVKPQDLLKVIRGTSSAQLPRDTFGGRLESLLPLQADISVRDILAPLAPEAPQAGERTERALHYRRFWRQSDERLRYDLAELLESGRASVVEKSSGAALNTLIRHKYDEICFGGRKFLTADGTVILATSDWIS
jgi:hypothetical protein